jgi:acyl-CoA synthetase (AMP-forming)/AMP-acid ligase II/thioesterase domain-containing protein/acyl carrier protein
VGEHAPRTVDELLTRTVERHPDRPAVVRTSGEVICSYELLLDRTATVSDALRQLGVGSQDVVVVAVPRSAEMLIAMLGVMRTAVCAPMNPAYRQGEIEELIDELHPVAAIVLDGEEGPTGQVASARQIPLLRLTLGGNVVDLDSGGAVDTDRAGNAAGPASRSVPQPTDIAMVLHTAGTTARPKQVPLTHANLVTAANNVVDSLGLVPDDRCLNVMPLFHSHGLLGAAMSSLAAGSSVVCADTMDPRRFLGWATETRSNWYTAAATIHQLVLDAPGDWPGLRLMRSASAPLAPQIAKALEDRFGAPMIEVYGMTEAYQIAANPLPPGERRLGTVGVATGTELAVADASGNHLPPGEEGEVVVRGPAVFAGYSAPPDANDEAFFGDWFRTGDLGRLSADGYLTITGRRKEQINRGGEKVAPREVDEALLAHPDIVAAMSFAIPDPLLGEEVGAAIVVRDGATVDARNVRAFLNGRVAPFKVPRRVLVVDQLPKSSTGKLQRVGFAAAHEAEIAALSVRHAAVVDEHAPTVVRLSAIWQELLEIDVPPGATDHFFELGGTSLLTMELVERIELAFGVDLPVIDVLEVPTLEEMADRIDNDAPSASGLLHRYRHGTSGSHLVLIPGQQGMAVGLNRIADAVTADVDIWLFDYPGHRAGEAPANSIEELATALVTALDTEGIAGVLAFYGNSLGSWVAFEAARTLESIGRTPLVVGIGDLYSPIFNTRNSDVRPPVRQLIASRLRQIRRAVERRFASVEKHEVSVAEARRRAVAGRSALSLKEYQAHPYGGDLLVFSADERRPKFGPLLGWDRHVTGTIEAQSLSGAHSTLHIERAGEIGIALSSRMVTVEPADPSGQPSTWS